MQIRTQRKDACRTSKRITDKTAYDTTRNISINQPISFVYSIGIRECISQVTSFWPSPSYDGSFDGNRNRSTATSAAHASIPVAAATSRDRGSNTREERGERQKQEQDKWTFLCFGRGLGLPT